MFFGINVRPQHRVSRRSGSSAFPCALGGIALQCLLLTFALTLGPASAAAAQDTVVHFGPEDVFQVRESGEVVIRSREALLPEGDEGEPVQVSFSFPDADSYELAMALGGVEIELRELESVILRGEEGEVQELSSSGLSPFELAAMSNGNLCGDIFARAAVELEEKLWVGISLHRGNTKAGYAVVSKYFECVNDVFGDCDWFAWGGCGGECISQYRWYGSVVRTDKNICTEFEVPGPNTCIC